MDNEEVLARHWHLGTTAMLISIALQVSLTFHNFKIWHILVFFLHLVCPYFIFCKTLLSIPVAIDSVYISL